MSRIRSWLGRLLEPFDDDGKPGKAFLWSLTLMGLGVFVLVMLDPKRIYVDPWLEAVRYSDDGINSEATILEPFNPLDRAHSRTTTIVYDDEEVELKIPRDDFRLPRSDEHRVKVVYCRDSPRNPWIGSREDGAITLWWRNHCLGKSYVDTVFSLIPSFFLVTIILFFAMVIVFSFTLASRSVARLAGVI